MTKNTSAAATVTETALDDDLMSMLGADLAELETSAQEAEKTEAAKPKKAPKKKAAPKAVEVKVEADVAVIEPVAQVEHVAGDLKELRDAFSLDERRVMADTIYDQFEDRISFEKGQPSLSAKMVPNLTKEQKKMSDVGTAGIFLATHVDPSFINRNIAGEKRYNVYALGKLNDLILALDAGIMQNAINRAITKSLFNFRDAGLPFTGVAALAAASDKVKKGLDPRVIKHLVRHTVSQATASTQKSSTMSALETLGIVKNVGTHSNENWVLTDTPQTRRLEEILERDAA